MTISQLPTPGWYRQIAAHLAIQQSEVFFLHGDVLGYPVIPGEGLTDYLQRMSLNTARRRVAEAQPERKRIPDNCPEVAALGIFAALSAATGLGMPSAHREVFDQYAPPPQDNPFAQQGGGGGLLEQFARVAQYLANPAAPPLALAILDADLLFDGEAPMVEPEKTLISYLRGWAAKPLLTESGDAHRIFLIGSAQAGIRTALVQGRICPIKLPLPTEDTRAAFIETMLDRAAQDERQLKLDHDLDIPLLARSTGALNLMQIEDVIYQAELEGGVLTRSLVQARKDDLVRQTYGGVLEIDYPAQGFDALPGCDALKQYMLGYVYPKLIAADGRCPKGCILSGPPGTGKTEFAKALAAALKLPLVIVRMDRIKSKYVGESNKNLARLCEGIIALAPAVILLDEIDKILPSSDDSTGVSQEMLGQLQSFLSEIPRGRAFFIATTNFPSRIPRALLRPGRFEQCIPMLPQHLDGIRHTVLQALAGRLEINHQISDSALVEISKSAADYTGADLERLWIEADREATEAGRSVINANDLRAALRYTVPTIKNTQRMIDEALAFCSSPRYVPDAMREKVGVALPTAQDDDETPRRRRIRNSAE